MQQTYAQAAHASPNAETAKTLAMLSVIFGVFTLVPALVMATRAAERGEPEARAALETSAVVGAVVVAAYLFLGAALLA